MKPNLIRRAAAGFCVAAMLAVNSVQSFAAAPQVLRAPEVNYSHRNEGGFTVSGQDRDLFSELKNLVPGDTVENTVYIKNDSAQSLTFYVKAYPGYEADGEGASRDGGPVVTEEGREFQSDLLDIMKMNITLEDGTYLYGDEAFSMPASGKGTPFEENDYGITIGSIPAHSGRTLTVSVKVPGADMGNDYAAKFGAVDWVFYVEGTDSSGGGGGGSHGGGGGGGSSHTGGSSGEATGPGRITTITDGEVPLAPGIGGGPGDVNITIADGAVPLSALAKTGGSVLYLKQAGIILAVLVIALAAVGFARKRKQKNL